MHRVVWLVLGLCLVGGVTLASADMSTQHYRELRAVGPSRGDAVRHYVWGVANGLSQANVGLHLAGRAPLYCEPESRELGVDDYLAILDREVDGPRRAEYRVVELALLRGLQRTFLCQVRQP